MPRQDDEYLEIVSLHQENTNKLNDILNLEQILFATAIIIQDDKSPCWCCMPSINPNFPHDEYCVNARKATEHLWKD